MAWFYDLDHRTACFWLSAIILAAESARIRKVREPTWASVSWAGVGVHHLGFLRIVLR